MSQLGILSRITGRIGQSLLRKSYGDGNWSLLGSTTPTAMNFWQLGQNLDKGSYDRFGPVYACVAILGQEMSRLPLMHMRYDKETGKQDEVTTSAAHRVFRNPNHYLTKSDWMLHTLRSLLLDGNSYAVVKRNDRGEVDSLYPVPPAGMDPYIAPDGGVYYRFSDSPTTELAALETDQWFPARDVLHIRLFTPRHPLMGESPMTAAIYPAMTGAAINQHNFSFFKNMSRPSGVLRHPKKLTPEAMERIKARFMELTQHNRTGEPIVLQEGMEWSPMVMNATDAELINSFKLTERQIAQVFRVPPFLLGDLEKATLTNVESLTRFFVQSGLGFYVDHIENALTKFFRLPAGQEIVFDLERALLKGDLKERMDAYAKGVQSGVYSPNEVRAKENLPPVENGDEPRVQQQLVPLAYGMELQPAGAVPPAPASPEEDPPPEEEPSDEEKQIRHTAEIIQLETMVNRHVA